MTVRAITVIIMLSVLVTACDTIRKATYPPDFVYLERSEVVGAMQTMSIHIYAIDEILANPETISAQQREQLIFRLRQIQKTVIPLTEGMRTNHTLLDGNIDGLLRDVIDARQKIENEPPDYYLVGRLVGTCLGCHVKR